MKLVILGTGNEAVSAVKSILNAKHTLIGVGPRPFYNVLSQSGGLTGAGLIERHQDIDYHRVKHVLMISYAALIRKEFLDRATFYNIHYALLPKYRGMHPVQWAIINGETSLGYTLHQVDSGIDSGPIFHQEIVSLDQNESYSVAKKRMTVRLEATLGDALREIDAGKRPVPQDDGQATFFTKRTPGDGLIDWRMNAVHIYNLIRAVMPPEMPGAYCFYKGEMLVIAAASLVDLPQYIGPTGKVVRVHHNSVYVKCGDGVLAVNQVIYRGKLRDASQVLKTVGTSLASTEPGQMKSSE